MENQSQGKNSFLKLTKITLFILLIASAVAWRILWAFTAGWYEVAAIVVAVILAITLIALPKE